MLNLDMSVDLIYPTPTEKNFARLSFQVLPRIFYSISQVPRLPQPILFVLLFVPGCPLVTLHAGLSDLREYIQSTLIPHTTGLYVYCLYS